MEYGELVDAFAAKCGVENPAAKGGTAVFEIDGITVGFIHDPAEDAIMVVAAIGEQNLGGADLGFVELPAHARDVLVEDRPHEADARGRGRDVLADVHARQDPLQPEH